GLLAHVGVLERLTSRATLGVAHARDLVGLRACLQPLPEIRTHLGEATAPLLTTARDEIAPLDALLALLQQALVDEPPLVLHEGGLIREGWSDALSALIEDSRQAREWIAGLEERERSRTGLSSLRVRFNRVFGYGIEVSHAQATRVPAEYVRRQTLTGAERYVTPELKEYETKVLGAEERRRRLEYELFEDVRRRVAAEAGPLLTTARALARLDVLLGLAEVAHFRGHVRPVVDAGDRIEIVDGRHPVLEARSTEPVTPNDLALDAEARVVILTGPNMSGKSVYLRQTGHLVILATHFHELTELANRLAAVRNFHVAVREWNDQIIFLHKVRPGGTDRSYGIQVARLAGLPEPVIARAKALLSELEAAGERTADARDAEQLGLFAVAPPDPILIELAHLDLAHLTPMEALNLLAKWQAQRGGVRKPEGV